MTKEPLDLLRRIKAYQAHVAGAPNQKRFIELCDELFAVLRQGGEWQPIEQLPQKVMVLAAAKQDSGEWSQEVVIWWPEIDGRAYIDMMGFTHFMPLPDPPSQS